ncbi:MAG: Hsp20/alpha crystallin family protein [Deltaproteobacteria bacterium]|jgi:HSP20 family molecular chaperone IbpA|nr:Hsp20/alpha crystallin family protein [Deltaproteobacteria bacterium]MBW2497501.1 Hsp20/alpha crystallin family protein [Deltaproteobacteria bacterium]
MSTRNESAELEPREKQAVEQEATRPGWVFRPDVDILEQQNGFVVFADLPGVDENTIDVHVEKGTLRLDAQLATLPGSDWRPLHTEYRFGSYHREFRISEDIDSTGVTAKMKNGVLELHLPKSERHKPRTIPVQSA